MKILIATGIYPPEIGGPAQYALNLRDIWQKEGHSVFVKVFSKWNTFPTGIRHIFYFFSIIPDVIKSDFILILDTYSSALPSTLAGLLFGKKIILRTGGDFLWESYVERTGDLVLLRDFYKTRLDRLSLKEGIIFFLTKVVLKNVDSLIWSTEWQKNIFMEPYGLSSQNHFVVENYYGPKVFSVAPIKKNFMAATRPLKWKNVSLLEEVFKEKIILDAGAFLDTTREPHEKFLVKMSESYGAVIVSLGDISPNTILDAISYNKPFILTRENGLTPRIKDIGIFVDPLSRDDIKEKVLWLCDPNNYSEQKKKVESFTFVHTWEDIARGYVDVYNKIK